MLARATFRVGRRALTASGTLCSSSRTCARPIPHRATWHAPSVAVRTLASYQPPKVQAVDVHGSVGSPVVSTPSLSNAKVSRGGQTHGKRRRRKARSKGHWHDDVPAKLQRMTESCDMATSVETKEYMINLLSSASRGIPYVSRLLC